MSRAIDSPTRRLLRAEWRRRRDARSNLLRATDRATRLRVARAALVGCALTAGVGWTAFRTLVADPDRPPVQGPLPALATLLALLVLADGFRRGSGALADPARRRAWEAWYRTAGVPKRALVVLGLVRSAAAALPLGWVPLIPLAADPVSYPPFLLLCALSAGWAAAVLGDGAGHLWRDAGRWTRIAIAAPVGLAFAEVLLALAAGAPGLQALGPWTVAVVVDGPWPAFAAAPVPAALLTLAAGVAGSALAHGRALEAAGWRSAAAAAVRRGETPSAVAARSPWAALAGRDLRVLRARARADVVMVAQGIGALVLLGAALAWVPPAMSAYLMRPGVMPWVLLGISFIPAAEYAEMLWGGEQRGTWAYLRGALARPRTAVRVRALGIAAGLAVWHAALAVVLGASSGAAGPPLTCAALGLAMAASGAATGTAGALTALRGGYGASAAGRYTRAIGLWTGLAAPAVAYAATGSLAVSIPCGIVLAAAGLLVAQRQYLRADFLSQAAHS